MSRGQHQHYPPPLPHPVWESLPLKPCDKGPIAAKRNVDTLRKSAPRRSWSSRWTFWSSWWYSSGVVPKNQNAQEPWVRLFQREWGRFQDGWSLVGALLSNLSHSLLLAWTGSSHLLYHKGPNWFFCLIHQNVRLVFLYITALIVFLVNFFNPKVCSSSLCAKSFNLPTF